MKSGENNGDKSCSCGRDAKKFSPKKYYEKLLEDPAVQKIFKERHGYELEKKDENNAKL